MCHGCWVEAGSPTDDNERVQAAVKALVELDETFSSGGYAHIVTDDYNVEDHHIDLCVKDAEAKTPPWNEFSDGTLELAALRAMKALTIPERYSALARRDGYVK